MEYKNIIGAEIRKLRNGLGMSQSEFAIRLQLAGFDVDRSQVSKMECRLVHISDYEQVYLAEVLKVSVADLYPPETSLKPAQVYVPKAMKRYRTACPRLKEREKSEALSEADYSTVH